MEVAMRQVKLSGSCNGTCVSFCVRPTPTWVWAYPATSAASYPVTENKHTNVNMTRREVMHAPVCTKRCGVFAYIWLRYSPGDYLGFLEILAALDDPVSSLNERPHRLHADHTSRARRMCPSDQMAAWTPSQLRSRFSKLSQPHHQGTALMRRCQRSRQCYFRNAPNFPAQYPYRERTRVRAGTLMPAGRITVYCSGKRCKFVLCIAF